MNLNKIEFEIGIKRNCPIQIPNVEYSAANGLIQIWNTESGRINLGKLDEGAGSSNELIRHAPSARDLGTDIPTYTLR